MTKVFIMWMISMACYAGTAMPASDRSEPAEVMKFKFDVELAGNVSVRNVIYANTSRTKKGTLKFRAIHGFKVVDSTGNCEDSCQLTSQQFTELLEKSISTVKGRIAGADISGIHFDMLLVQELKDAAVSTVKSQSLILKSKVGQKDTVLDASVRNQLNDLEATRHICMALAASEIQCRSHPIDFNPIFFNEDLTGKPWRQIIDERNAGLHPDNWISLMIEGNGK